ncbi:MAG TPA: argininosuccinate lyase [Micromonosporaceae bacterium]
MIATGRLTATLGRRSQRIVYGRPDPEELRAELDRTTRIDQAHLVMLVDQGLISRTDAARILLAIDRLRRAGFAPLLGLPTPRGLYLAYENYLIHELGGDVGGRLHTGRSRNDLKASATALRLRAVLLELLGELNRLRAVLLSRARAYRATIMPVHTHYQPAMPATYGYYLLGVAVALGRDSVALRRCLDDLDRCPLGAGAITGTDLPIDPTRTAALLGFVAPSLHALDAIASRDNVLRALAAAAGAGLTLSRLATDLQLWSTVEFGFVEFPDRLVGGSSAMPQKRNAFLLEHVKAKPAAAVGAWTAMAQATATAPFTNSIEVGTEAVAAAWPGFRAVLDAVALSQVLVSGARPKPDRMLAGVQDNYVTATVLANRLVRRGVPFRQAHHQVGAAVRSAIAEGRRELILDDPSVNGDGAVDSLDEVVAQHRAGGGPGAFDEVFRGVHAELADEWGHLNRVRNTLRQARRDLAAAVETLIAEATGGHGVG